MLSSSRQLLQPDERDHRESYDDDGAPLSPLQRIASGLPMGPQVGRPHALSAIAIKLDLSHAASPSTPSSICTPEQPRRAGPPAPHAQNDFPLSAKDYHGEIPAGNLASARLTAITAHAKRNRTDAFGILTPSPQLLPPGIPVVATERCASYYPSGHAAELECSRCDEWLPATSAYCHSCGGAMVIPIVSTRTARTC